MSFPPHQMYWLLHCDMLTLKLVSEWYFLYSRRNGFAAETRTLDQGLPLQSRGSH
jgi:hypothetical protein